MEPQNRNATRLLTAFCGVASLAPYIFFGWYSLRLLYINLTTDDAAAHRSGGMLIGAIAFPLATIIFGLISWLSIKRAFRPSTTK